MASDGLFNLAKTGKCRICHRVRKTVAKVKAVGEVRHGYATGHIWECIDKEDCDKVAKAKIVNKKSGYRTIEIALQQGRYTRYICLG